MGIPLNGLNKADVLVVLYNASKPQGMGFMHYDPKPMTRKEAEALLDQTTYFDYLNGRVMKVSLSGDELNPRLYDRDNGPGAAERAISELRRTGQTNPTAVQAAHHVNTLEAAENVKSHLHEETRREGNVFTLGLADVADVLGPKVDEAIEKRRTE